MPSNEHGGPPNEEGQQRRSQVASVSVGDAAQREDDNEARVASLTGTGWEVQSPHRFGSALSLAFISTVPGPFPETSQNPGKRLNFLSWARHAEGARGWVLRERLIATYESRR
jgi:hypothetical protein